MAAHSEKKSQVITYIAVITNCPEELMASGYYAKSLLRFTNGLEMCRSAPSSTNVHLG